MEISKITPYSYFTSVPPKRKEDLNFKGNLRLIKMGSDEFIKKPVVRKSATGFLNRIKNFFKEYTENVKRTYEHKIVFAIIEKELYGKNSIDSITHDLDKLVLYALGFPKSFVSRFHRAHSEHHVESGKKLNLRSVVCDNIASSPDFKPKKKYRLRDYFQISPELQKIEGLEEVLKKYNFGEDLNFEKVKEKSSKKYHGAKAVFNVASKAAIILFGALS